MKYGLALGGGGLRGIAHLGVLKVLEGAGFKPDIIAGTSAGALIGALYAKGFSVDEILKLSERFSFFKVMRLDLDLTFDALSTLDGLRNALKPLLGGVTFKDLNIKLLAIATSLKTGHEVVIEKGDLIEAIVTSACVPGVFEPVRKDDDILVDGSVVSPVPVNVLKERGVKKVISVSLGTTSPKIGRLNVTKVVSRAMNITIDELMDLQEKNADVAIRVPTGDYSTISPKKANELYHLGAKFARKKLRDIKKLLKQ